MYNQAKQQAKTVTTTACNCILKIENLYKFPCQSYKVNDSSKS